MKIWTFYKSDVDICDVSEADFYAIKDGFNPWIVFFPFIWGAYKGFWAFAVIALLVQGIFLYTSNIFIDVAIIVVSIYAGFEHSLIARFCLLRMGYKETYVTYGSDYNDACSKFIYNCAIIR